MTTRERLQKAIEALTAPGAASSMVPGDFPAAIRELRGAWAAFGAEGPSALDVEMSGSDRMTADDRAEATVLPIRQAPAEQAVHLLAAAYEAAETRGRKLALGAARDCREGR